MHYLPRPGSSGQLDGHTARSSAHEPAHASRTPPLLESGPLIPGCCQILSSLRIARVLRPQLGRGQVTLLPVALISRLAMNQGSFTLARGLRPGLCQGIQLHTWAHKGVALQSSPFCSRRATTTPQPAPTQTPAPLPSGGAASNCLQFAGGSMLDWTLRETKQPKTAPS